MLDAKIEKEKRKKIENICIIKLLVIKQFQEFYASKWKSVGCLDSFLFDSSFWVSIFVIFIVYLRVDQDRCHAFIQSSLSLRTLNRNALYKVPVKKCFSMVVFSTYPMKKSDFVMKS